MDMAARSSVLSSRSAAAVALLLALGSIGVPSPAYGDYTVARAEPHLHNQPMTPRVPTSAVTFSPACRAAACRGKTDVSVRVSTCIFSRLSADRPPFVIICNPKSGSTTLRLMMRTFGLETMFEAQCALDHPLDRRVAARLGVTGWEQVSALMIVRQPMDRFISGWEEITRRAPGWLGKPVQQRSGKGFEFLRDPQNLGPEGPPPMMRRFRTADNFERYMKTYLQLVENTKDLTWDYDPHAGSQVMRLGVCSQQQIRSITAVKMDDLAVGIPNFLLTYADATEERDGAILEAFRNPINGRGGVHLDLLDVRELVKQDRFKGLWEAVKHSRLMIADHICTGYAQPIVDIQVAEDL